MPSLAYEQCDRGQQVAVFSGIFGQVVTPDANLRCKRAYFYLLSKRMFLIEVDNWSLMSLKNVVTNSKQIMKNVTSHDILY